MSRLSFAFILSIVFYASATSLDERLFLEINGKRSNTADLSSTLIGYTTNLGYAFWTYQIGRGIYVKDKGRLNLGLMGYYTSIANAVATQSIKAAVKRERPIFAVDGAQGDYEHPKLVKNILTTEQYSFPSWALSEASCFATLVSHKYHLKWPAVAGMYTWVALIGYSRIYKGAHYPGDVLGGILIGAAVAEGMLCLDAKGRLDRLKVSIGSDGEKKLEYAFLIKSKKRLTKAN